MPEFKSLLHASVLVANTRISLAFYCDVLGLVIDTSRPDFAYPGAWLKIGQQQIHLIELPNPDTESVRPAHGGHDHHIAIGISNVSSLCKRLDAASYPYTASKSGRKAIFCRDPDANALEFIEE